MGNFEQIQRLADRYISDPEFRVEMSQDPEGTARQYGVKMDDATRQILRGVDWGGQALPGRLSKRVIWC